MAEQPVESASIDIKVGHVATTVMAPVTDEGRDIAYEIFPKVLRRFMKNNAKYAGVQKGLWLGAKGIIPDVNRKSAVLIDRIWGGAEEIGEGTPQVIDDLIGHLLLLRWAYEEEMSGRKTIERPAAARLDVTDEGEPTLRKVPLERISVEDMRTF